MTFNSVVTALTHADPGSRTTVHVARQPIFDSSDRVVGYELLYRASATTECCDSPDDASSARVLTDAVLLMGLETLSGGRPAFLNVTRHFLLGDAPTLLPPAGVVLEILETVGADDQVVAACRWLSDAGYTLALDDYVPGSDAERLLPYARFVKVDVLQTPATQLRGMRNSLPGHISVLAEKVETAAALETARAGGATLFQGFYFSRPTTFSSTPPPAHRLSNARLLASLYRPGVTLPEIETLIKTDVALTYYVLRSINSAAFGVKREIRSLQQALVLLGLEQVRTWASVWALAGVSPGGNAELMTMALVRARCCEAVARAVRAEPPELFLVGLCSLLDVMLGSDMPNVLRGLPLSPAVRQALAGEPGISRQILDAVLAYEKGDWDDVSRRAGQLSLPESRLAQIYGEALGWYRTLDI